MRTASLLIIMLVLAVTLGMAQQRPLFERLKPEQTGIDFAQRHARIVLPKDSVSKINSMVPGAGVAIGDFTGDGRPDIVFSAFSGCGFYRNDGEFRFTDVTAETGIPVDSTFFSTGLNLVDIDADGDLDLFIARWQNTCRLLINDGKGRFTEQAAAYGLDFKDETVHSVFFDYNGDGLLDCYLVTYSNWYAMRTAPRPPDSVEQAESVRRQREGQAMPRFEASSGSLLEDQSQRLRNLPASEVRHQGHTDKLFRNLGNGTFEDASYAAWIGDRGMGLSATVADINLDGWPDIYVANDFNSTDLIYLNNGDGSFAESMKKVTRKASVFSMGSDVADLNRDGLPDIITTDMLPKTHVRRILNVGVSGDMSIYNPTYDSNQVSRNMVQLNRGYNQFSDIGYMTGMAATDWSWACLIQDFDLDGLADVYIANGYTSDLSNQDYVYNMNRREMEDIPLIEALREPNFMFRQTSYLRFDDATRSWGLNDTSTTFGTAYGDLDDDGDLDLVVPNFDTVAFVYRNNAREQSTGNFLSVSFIGSAGNTGGLGAKIRVVAGGFAQYKEHYPVRGYQSRMDDKMIFGLGKATMIDSIIVQWPDGTAEIRTGLNSNAHVELRQSQASASVKSWFRPLQPDTTVFVDVTESSGLNYWHKENYFDDFKRYRLMPTRVSWGGPAVAVADINGDGLDDVMFGHSKGQNPATFVQKSPGRFEVFSTGLDGVDTTYETQAMLLVDIDRDGDRDLVCGGGGAEYGVNERERGLRIYVNNGKGRFSRSSLPLPDVNTNAATLNACDFDSDGDMDLFVGGGVATDTYPYCDPSYLLLNNGKGVFRDVTDSIAPGLRDVGIVRSALWSDVDNDERFDLVVVGEWMPITMFRNDSGRFVNVTKPWGLDSTVGWWYSITGADIDNDGDIDYVCGNHGENSRYAASSQTPIEIYAGDFDDNGSVDPLITYMVDGKRQLVRERPKVFSQMPTLNRKFNDFVDFAFASINEVVDSSMLDTCYHRSITSMQSMVLVNNGSGLFNVRPLPLEAQFSPVMGVEALDLNDDEWLDLVLTGNMYGAEDDVVRYDAGKGLVLFGSSAGEFRPLTLFESGFVSQYDARGLVSVRNPGKSDVPFALVSSVNQGAALVYSPNNVLARTLKAVAVDPGRVQKLRIQLGTFGRCVEVYCGSSYRSQTSCNVLVPKKSTVVGRPPARGALKKRSRR
ncbi:MAG: hypothetical protein FGM33_09175 [Candidatus Kapabacteria bacterium]|nr:hypothetical protein [Candidatus Kapabacteria bacterium]